MITAEGCAQYKETLSSRGYTGKYALQDYLEDLAREKCVDTSHVRSIVLSLGTEQLFDGVVTAVEQFAKNGRVEYNV